MFGTHYKRPMFLAIQFSHSDQPVINAKLDGSHSHGTVEMALGLHDLPCVFKISLNRSDDSKQDTKHQKKYDKQCILGHWRTGCTLHFTQVSNCWLEPRVQFQCMPKVHGSLLIMPIGFENFPKSVMLQPSVLFCWLHCQRSTCEEYCIVQVLKVEENTS